MAANQFPLQAAIRQQPMREYRFRFVTENARSILYSRSGHLSPDRYILVSLETEAAALPIAQGQVSVSVSTVNSEGLIHPYYLVGGGCEAGVYRARLDFPSAAASGIVQEGRIGTVVELSDVAIFCVRRNREALTQAIRDRLQTGEIPFFHPSTQQAEEVYINNTAQLDSVCLAFVFCHHGLNQTVRLVTEPITRAPRTRQGVRPLMLPPDLPLLPHQRAWLHIDGLARANALNLSLMHHHDPIADVQYNAVKPNLLELMLHLRPGAQLPPSERIQCDLRISDGTAGNANEHSASVFICRNSCPLCSQSLLFGGSASGGGFPGGGGGGGGGGAGFPGGGGGGGVVGFLGDPEDAAMALDELEAFMQEVGDLNNLGA